MDKRLHIDKENIVYIILWLALFTTPVISLLIRTQQGDGTFQWSEIFPIWKVYAVLLVAFCIHNFLIAPLLLKPSRRWRYFAGVAALMAVFLAVQCSMPEGREPDGRPGMENRMRPEPPERPVVHDDRRPDMPRRRGITPPPSHMFGPRQTTDLVLLVFLLSINVGVKLYFRSRRRDQEMQELQRENLHAQLEYLKYQVNPHFFMNTLNNIHALVDIDPEMAKDAIVQLSKMMRYILYEGNQQMVPLQKETQFLQSYLHLMRLRYTDKVDIRCDIAGKMDDATVPPLLLITFVENAFKHGISYARESFVHIALRTEEGRISFSCNNSRHSDVNDEHGGVGLQNARRRLDLIYGENYTLFILDSSPESYNVELSLPLNK